MGHDAFISGVYDTHFVGNHFKPENMSWLNHADMDVIHSVASVLLKAHHSTNGDTSTATATSKAKKSTPATDYHNGYSNWWVKRGNKKA